MRHLDEGTIHAWLDGALAGEDAAVTARHIDECRECAAMVAEARGMIAATGRIVSALDDVPAGVIPTPRQPRTAQHSLWRRLQFTPARAALAATVLLTVGTLFASRHNEMRKDVITAEQTAAAPIVARKDSQVTAERAPAPTEARPATDAAPATSTSPRRREEAAATVQNAAPESRMKAAAGAATRTADAPPAFRTGAVAAPPPPAADVAGVPAAAPRIAAKAGDTRFLQQRAAVPTPMSDSLVIDTAGAAARRRKLDKVRQLEAVTMTGAQTSRAQRNDPQGCYHVQEDSAGALRGIPLRFALQLVPGSDANVVRAVSPDGHLDSVMAGSTWRPAAPDRVTVSFASAGEPQRLTLHFTSSGSVAQAIAGGREAAVSVQRVDCRP